MKSYRTEDGYRFFQHTDGTLTDTRVPMFSDMEYRNLAELAEAVDVTADEEPHTLYEYFELMLGDGCNDFGVISMESECGIAAKSVIDAAYQMELVCDPAVWGQIIDTTNAAIGVIVFG